MVFSGLDVAAVERFGPEKLAKFARLLRNRDDDGAYGSSRVQNMVHEVPILPAEFLLHMESISALKHLDMIYRTLNVHGKEPSSTSKTTTLQQRMDAILGNPQLHRQPHLSNPAKRLLQGVVEAYHDVRGLKDVTERQEAMKQLFKVFTLTSKLPTEQTPYSIVRDRYEVGGRNQLAVSTRHNIYGRLLLQ